MPKVITVTLPYYSIVITHSAGNRANAAITSKLKGDIAPEDIAFNAAMDAIESMLLAHYCAGIDVTTPLYVEGLKTAIRHCADAM